MVSLPTELYTRIIYELRHETDSLKACSLSGSILRLISQEHLLSKVTIGHPCCNSPYKLSCTPSELKDLLYTSSHIAKFIRFLAIYDVHDNLCTANTFRQSGWLPHDVHLQITLPLLHRLVTLKVVYESRFDGTWSDIPGPLIQAFVQTLRLPSLTTVNIENAPVFSFLRSGGSNIKELVLHCYDFGRNPSIEELTTGPPQTILLESVKAEHFCNILELKKNFLEDSPGNISLTALQKLEISGSCMGYGLEECHAALAAILEKCAETLKIFVFWPSGIVRYLATNYNEHIDISTLKTLKRLELRGLHAYESITNEFPYEDNTLWLIHLLGRVSGVNEKLEEILVELSYDFSMVAPSDFDQIGDFFIAQWNEVAGVLLNGCYPKLRLLQIENEAGQDEYTDIAKWFEESGIADRLRPGGIVFQVQKRSWDRTTSLDVV